MKHHKKGWGTAMSIRVKVILIVSGAIAAVTAANLGMSLLFTQQNLIETTEADLKAIAQIADAYVTSEMDLLKADAAGAAQYLSTVSDEQLEQAITGQIERGDAFIGMTVLGRNGIVSQGGTYSVPAEVLGSESVERAFVGEGAISTTRYAENGALVIDVCVPMTTERVLSATIPGRHFSDLLSPIRVWETGNVFIVDNEGTSIANVRSNLVTERFNFITQGDRDNRFKGAAPFITEMIKGEPTSGFYTIDGQSRLCFGVPVTGSREGWSLGVAAPLDESPITHLREGLLLSELLFLAVGIIVAIFASKRIARPVEEKYRRNEELAELKAKAEHASEAKSAFLANTSHEMRTPLNAIVGLSDLQLLEDHDKATQADLLKIHNAGTTLLSIINDILDISKIESGKFDIVPSDYDVASLINDTVTMSMMRIGSKPIEFVLRIDEALPVTLNGDELRVKQVFNNLLSNAFKYTKKGTVTWDIGFERYEVAAQPGAAAQPVIIAQPVVIAQPGIDDRFGTVGRPDEGVMLVVRIADTGIGIRPEDIGKLFGDYSQVDVKSNRSIEGTGLGLAIARRLVKIMGGSIEVQSVYGEGSTFTVRIPQGFVTGVPIGHQTVSNLQRFQYTEGKLHSRSSFIATQLPYARVLLVDDNQTNLAVAHGMMKRYGMKIDCVDNGPAAIELIRDSGHRYNAVFMDHMMPGMDGIETFERIRAIGTEYATSVPVIALTANAVVGNAEMFIDKGFAAFLPKPIDIMQLDGIIRQWVRDKDYERSMGQDFENHVSGSAVVLPPLLEELDALGIDVACGLERFGGDVKEYVEILRLYIAETRSLLAQLDTLEMRDLNDYAVVMHGIRGSSRGVGVEELAAMADRLEAAAKNRDRELVREKNGIFAEHARVLIADMEQILDAFDPQEDKPYKNEPDHAALERLREAAANFSIDGVEEALDELEVYNYQTQGELIVWLRKQCENLAFSEIVVQLSDYTDIEEGGSDEYQEAS
jgi:signal transduction histidine kinase/FixJ family two-component response regulator/HPt (histidine-containing phosphotransfer) domain-containing protein